AAGVGLTLAAIDDGSSSYTAFELTVASASLLGVPGVTLYVTSLDLKLNKVTGPAVALDWSGFGIAGLGITSATDLDVSATLALDLGGFVVAAGSAHVSKQTVTGSFATPQSALVVTVSGASLFVGVGGSLDAAHSAVVAGSVGISASGVGLTLAAIDDGSSSYTAFELTVASASLLGGPGVTLNV